MGTKRSDAVDPPRPLRDKESNRQGTDPTSPEHPHLDENNLLWENQTTPLRGAPPRRDCPVDAGLSEKDYCKKNPSNGGCEKYTTPPDNNCCQAYNAKCESCKQGISEEEYCKKNPSTDFFGGVQGCEKYHKGDGG